MSVYSAGTHTLYAGWERWVSFNFLVFLSLSLVLSSEISIAGNGFIGRDLPVLKQLGIIGLIIMGCFCALTA